MVAPIAWLRQQLQKKPLTSVELTRFISKLGGDQRAHDCCWIWLGSKTKGGRGRVNTFYPCFWLRGRNVYAHQLSFLAFGPGEIDENFEHVDHACETSLCVRPDHTRALCRLMNMELGRTKRNKLRCSRV